jgi:glycosyltransferase involved in cell wall biosynthesis
MSCETFAAPAFRCAHMMARGLAGNDCEVDFVVGGMGLFLGTDHEECADYTFQCFASTPNAHRSFYKYYSFVKSGIIKKRWDVVLFYSVGLQFVPLVMYARRCGVKIIYVQGDHYVPLPGMNVLDRLKLFIINSVDVFMSRKSDLNALTGTSVLLEHYRKQAPVIPIYLSYPPIDVDLFSAGDSQKALSKYNLKDKLVIVYCGSVVSLEGIEIMLNAMRVVSQFSEQAHLVIAGKLDVVDYALSYKVDYKKISNELGIRDRVTFTDFIDQVAVRDLLSAANILLMPKLDHHRNAVAAPIKLSEYLASGRPVIASSVGDVSERFEDGIELCLCEPGDSSDLALKIIYMLDNPHIAEQIADNGQEYARKHFDYISWGKQVLNLL